MASIALRKRDFENGRSGYQRGLKVLVNGSTNQVKPLPPHVAEHAAEMVEGYVTKLENTIGELLRTINASQEVEH